LICNYIIHFPFIFKRFYAILELIWNRLINGDLVKFRAMEFIKSPYYRVGRATDLTGRDYYIYRALEILSGLMAWTTIVLIFVASYYYPYQAAIFIIIFDFYWLLKTAYLSIYLRQSWKKIRQSMEIDWEERLENFKYNHIYQMVIFPFYNESPEIVLKSLEALDRARWKNNFMIIVLAGEEKAKDNAHKVFQAVQEKYGKKFKHIVSTVHPASVPGEMAGKGSNIAYAAQQTKIEMLDKNNIKYENVIVSAFDVDTIVYPHYFNCLTWYFLVSDDPYRTSFQPVPVFNNNIWESPAFSRVVAFSGTFWQMIQQERPEKLATFSSHAVCFKALYDMDYWQKNIVSEDSRIYWNAVLAFNGKYKVTPIYYPVSMDVNLASTFWQTAINVYKQQRRWAWGAENFPYIVFGFIKNKGISVFKKISVTFVLVEGLWSWSTNSLIIFLLGWAPIVLGGRKFDQTVIAYNMPILTKYLMVIAMSGLILSALIMISFLPAKPKNTKPWSKFTMVIQWIIIPITIIVFGAIPAIDAQTRLMFKKYMGFWVTPKHRANLKKND